MTRSRKSSLLFVTRWEDIIGKPSSLGIDAVTFEALQANGDIGAGQDQVSPGDHDHEIGDVSLTFENALI